MKKVKKIGVLSLGSVLGLGYAAMGLILGLIVTVFSLVGTSFSDGPMIFFGSLSIILLPIIYGVMGFITGALTALVYNLIAKINGGLELEIEE